jgi:ATP-binding cassette, subfamily B, multidrug efflux pump
VSPEKRAAAAPRAKGIEARALEMAGDPILAKMLAEERVESKVWDTALLGRLLKYLRPHSGLAWLSIGLALIEALIMTAPAFLIGLALDRVGAAGGARPLDGWLSWFGQAEAWWTAQTQHNVIVMYGLIVGGLWFVRWLVGASTNYSMQVLGQRVVHDIRVEIFQHITSMDLSWFHKNPVGRLVNRTTFDVQTLSELFSNALAQGVRDLMFVAVLVVVMVALDLPLAAILIASLPVLVGIALVYRRYARPAMRTTAAVLSRMNAWLAENLSGMRENHLYRQEDRRRAEYHALTTAHQTSVARVIQAWGLLRPAMMVTTALGTTTILLLGYERVTTGLITVGVLLTFLQYTVQIWKPVRNLTEKFNMIQTALASAERIVDVLDARPTLTDLPTADPTLQVTQGAISFDDVRFRYKRNGAEILRGISFQVAPGQMLALVGDTGAGKTTVSALLSRFYDVESGHVRIDGHDVRDYQLQNLRPGLALVPQDVVIFAGTVRENITLGADIPEERLLASIRGVRADAFIDRMDGGLDHVLEEGGRTLSTGQRQLLSFARALCFNPPILVLDEATANVDTETELLIQNALEVLTEGRTSVVIAHRLSTIRSADLILLLRAGEVVEQGNHAELMGQGGEYAALVEKHLRTATGVQ